jgi:hypothetical protein
LNFSGKREHRLTGLGKDPRHRFMKRIMPFEPSDCGLGRSVAVVKTFTIKSVLQAILSMIST